MKLLDMMKKWFLFLIALIATGTLGVFYSIFEGHILQLLSSWPKNTQPQNILRISLGVSSLLVLALAFWISELKSQIKEKTSKISSAARAAELSLRNNFGAYWDSQFNMYCLNCLQPLKKSSNVSPSWFYCSDPHCNSKHILKDDDGYELSRQQAIDRMSKK